MKSNFKLFLGGLLGLLFLTTEKGTSSAPSLETPLNTLSALPPHQNSSTHQMEVRNETKKKSLIPCDRVILQGLNKITARVFTVTARLHQLVTFGTLKIYARACYTTPPEDPPESYCFMEIWETFPDQQDRLIFSGWMLASTPSLHPLQHGVYDVWIKEGMASTEKPPQEYK